MHGIVEYQVNSSVTVQQVSADTEVRERVLREHVEKTAQEEQGSVQTTVMSGPTRGVLRNSAAPQAVWLGGQQGVDAKRAVLCIILYGGTKG